MCVYLSFSCSECYNHRQTLTHLMVSWTGYDSSTHEKSAASNGASLGGYSVRELVSAFLKGHSAGDRSAQGNDSMVCDVLQPASYSCALTPAMGVPRRAGRNGNGFRVPGQ